MPARHCAQVEVVSIEYNPETLLFNYDTVDLESLKFNLLVNKLMN